jgi:hypothetical protein
MVAGPRKRHNVAITVIDPGQPPAEALKSLPKSLTREVLCPFIHAHSLNVLERLPGWLAKTFNVHNPRLNTSRIAILIFLLMK